MPITLTADLRRLISTRLPIRRSHLLSLPNGQQLPLLWVARRPDIDRLFALHHAQPGRSLDFRHFWHLISATAQPPALWLELVFSAPIRCTLALQFKLPGSRALLGALIAGQPLGLLTGAPPRDSAALLRLRPLGLGGLGSGELARLLALADVMTMAMGATQTHSTRPTARQ